jgi:hypothetical protein
VAVVVWCVVTGLTKLVLVLRGFPAGRWVDPGMPHGKATFSGRDHRSELQHPAPDASRQSQSHEKLPACRMNAVVGGLGVIGRHDPQGSRVRLFDFRTRGFACGGVGRRRCCQGSKHELGGPGGTASFGDERRLVLDNAHQTARSLCRGCLSKSAAIMARHRLDRGQRPGQSPVTAAPKSGRRR